MPETEETTPTPEPTVDSKGRPFITKAKLKEHDQKNDVWMSIQGKVYNVTKYLEDHPGGEEVLLDRAGQDATDDFEDVGHSNDARKTLEKFEVGELPPSERAAKSEKSDSGGSSGALLAIPVLLIAAGVGYYLAFMQG